MHLKIFTEDYIGFPSISIFLGSILGAGKLEVNETISDLTERANIQYTRVKRTV